MEGAELPLLVCVGLRYVVHGWCWVSLAFGLSLDEQRRDGTLSAMPLRKTRGAMIFGVAALRARACRGSVCARFIFC